MHFHGILTSTLDKVWYSTEMQQSLAYIENTSDNNLEIQLKKKKMTMKKKIIIMIIIFFYLQVVQI